jgi:Uma2 family endonuclease
MSTATLVSMEEYLATSYRPDCDYVDGTLVDRNVGQKDHSKVQRGIIRWFGECRRALRVDAFPEQRVQVNRQRCRVPDICVVRLPEPDEQVFTQPPYICIEVLSPEDTFPRLQERFDDYLEMGVPNVWVIDPASHRGWGITHEGHLEARDGCLRTHDGQVSLPIAELFMADD